ncbi:MAG: hypothetical protein IPJ30_04660 [Acidobacteria bacterium]|nr:hypothetical protein [Acidobacteriota bacterium]
MFRTDYQAFGETIESGIGLRTTAQGFGSPASNRYRGRLSEADFSMGEEFGLGRLIGIRGEETHFYLR